VSLYKDSKNKDYVGELYRRYTGFVVAVCRNYLNNTADCEDACMQIFEKLFNDLLRFEVANFKSWLHVIAKNHCMMILRKPHREIFTDQFVEKHDAIHLHEAKEKDCGCGCGGSCSDDKQANASGNFPGKPNQAENCAVCKDAQTGLTYHTSENRSCKRGDTCMSKYSILQS
jgi:RNA polymerase sigma factor (sigma-70 family)